MAKVTDPFTRTPGIAGEAYIDNGIAEEIIESFRNEGSAKYVYKITGLRGSGKSVEYGRVIRTFKEDPGWLVYTLSAAGDAVKTLIAKLSMENFIDAKQTTTVVGSTTTVGGNAVVVSGNESVSVQKTTTEDSRIFSEEALLTRMVETAGKKNYKILIGIDDIAKTNEMVALLSIIDSMILEGLPIYLLVTGLAENIEEFASEKHLTFFMRADAKEIKSLNRYDVVYMYQKLLSVDAEEARKIEAVSQDYAYAYQVLGSLYFSKKKNETLEDLMPDFERILFRDSYDLIWKSLSETDKELVRCIYKSGTGRTEDIKALMKHPAGYPVYRDRLINKHVVDGDTRGRLTIRLPRFDRFIEIWDE